MPSHGLRFIHASDLHLERPPYGLAEIPDHLRDLLVEVPYLAAQRVFDAALAEEVDLLILAGDVIQPEHSGPRGPLFLLEQFQRLAERGIQVYWAGGSVDPPDVWPSWASLPEHVHLFPRARVAEYVYQRGATPVARVLGASRDRNRPIHADNFVPDATGLFSIGILHGAADATVLRGQGLNYWALGGRHGRSTLFNGPQTGHYAGSTQGRHPDEHGPHGCTLVQLDEQGAIKTSALPTDVLRFVSERVALEAGASRDDLETLLRERIASLAESSPDRPLLISWTVTGSGPVTAALRRGPLATELLARLRTDFGCAAPAPAWSVSLDADLPDDLPLEWYEQQTILGEYLRDLRHYEINPSVPLEFGGYLGGQTGTALAEVVGVGDGRQRQRVLREAALLGVDLLGGEGPQS
jgi:exonuclease SbcD